MNDAPEKIYGWMNTQLSVARFYGGLEFRGATYRIAYDEKDQPLVRVDVKRKETRADKAKAKREREAWKRAQEGFRL